MVDPGDEFGFFQNIHVGTDVKVVISPMTTKLRVTLRVNSLATYYVGNTVVITTQSREFERLSLLLIA